jgi:hypothetical protein
MYSFLAGYLRVSRFNILQGGKVYGTVAKLPVADSILLIDWIETYEVA